MKRRSDLLISVLMLCVFTFFCAGVAPAFASGKHCVTILYTPNPYGEPIIELKAGKGIVGHFALDTGSGSSFISPEFAALLKIKPNTVKIGSDSYELLSIPRLEIGDANLFAVNMPVQLKGLKEMSELYSRQVDGVIGGNVLKAHAMAIDFPNQTISFWDGGNLSRDDLQDAGFADAGVSPIVSPRHDRTYYVKTRINYQGHSRDIDLLLDTSMRFNTITREQASSLVLPLKPYPNWPDHIFGTADKIQSGGIQILSPSISVSTADEVHPTMGVGTFKQTKILIDVDGGKLYVSPNVFTDGTRSKPAAVPFEPNRWGVPIVELKVANKLMGHFLIATDSNSTFVTPKFAARLNLKTKPVKFGRNSFDTVTLPLLELGRPDLYFVNETVYVDDLAAYKDSAPEIDGLLGADILSVIAIAIDYPKRQVLFWDHGSLSGDELEAADFAAADVADVTRTPGDFQYSVQAHFKNHGHSHSVSLLIDTDAQYNILTRDDAIAIGVPLAPSINQSGVDAATPESMVFGTATMSDPSFEISPADSNYSAIGISTLSQWRFLFDCPSGKIYFVPMSNP